GRGAGGVRRRSGARPGAGVPEGADPTDRRRRSRGCPAAADAGAPDAAALPDGRGRRGRAPRRGRGSRAGLVGSGWRRPRAQRRRARRPGGGHGGERASGRAELTEVRDRGGGRLRLRGWAFLDNVDLTDRAVAVRLTARCGEASVPVEVRPEDAADADVACHLWYADIPPSGFAAEVDTSALHAGTGTWHLEAAVSVAGLSGSGLVQVRPWTMAGIPAWRDKAGRGWHVDHDDAQRVELRVSPPHWPRLGLAVEGDRLRLEFPSGSVRSVSLEAPGRPPVPAALFG